MVNPERGDIYFVEIEEHEHIGHEFYGPHFYVVVSNNALRGLGTVVVVPLTSQPKDQGGYGKFRIRISESQKERDNPSERACSGTSVALTEQVRVMSVDRFKNERIGKLKPGAMAWIEVALAFVLMIPPPMLQPPISQTDSQSPKS